MVGLVGTHLIHNPLGIVLLVAVLRAETSNYVWNAIAVFLLSAACGGISMYFGSLRSADDALSLLFDGQFKYQELDEIPFKDFASFIPEPLMRRLKYPRSLKSQYLRRGASLGPASNEYLLKLFVRRFPKPPFDHLLKAYSSGVGSSMIFLLDDPREPMTAFAKFKLFHEIAHITADGNMVLAHRYRRMCLAVVTAAWGFYLSSATGAVFVGIGLILVSAIGSFLAFELECESKADALALTCLSNDERSRVLHLCEKDWTRVDGPNPEKEQRQRRAAFAIRLNRLRRNIQQLNKGRMLHFGFSWNSRGWLSWSLMVAGALALGYHSRPMTVLEAIICCVLAILIVSLPGSWLHDFNAKAERVLEMAVRDFKTKSPEERAKFWLS